MGKIRSFFGGIGVTLFIIVMVCGIALLSVVGYQVAIKNSWLAGPASNIKNAYPSVTMTATTTQGVGSAAKLLLSANVSRQYTLIQNTSANTVFICLSATSTCTSLNLGIRLLTNESYEIDSSNLYTGAISATSSVSTSSLLITSK